jgi:hypothetical protein
MIIFDKQAVKEMVQGASRGGLATGEPVFSAWDFQAATIADIPKQINSKTMYFGNLDLCISAATTVTVSFRGRVQYLALLAVGINSFSDIFFDEISFSGASEIKYTFRGFSVPA